MTASPDELLLDESAADRAHRCSHGRVVAAAECAGVIVVVTDHAVERWVERAKPCLDLEVAADDLTRTIGTVGRVVLSPPGWASDGLRRGAHGWIWIGDDI